MNIRKTLIIIVSIVILLLFGLVSSISYNFGMSYGVDNAETIRALKVVRDCYKELGYFKLIGDIQLIIDANDISPEVESKDTSWNFFQRKAPAPSQS